MVKYLSCCASMDLTPWDLNSEIIEYYTLRNVYFFFPLQIFFQILSDKEFWVNDASDKLNTGISLF